MAERTALERSLLIAVAALGGLIALGTLGGFIAGKRPGDGPRRESAFAKPAAAGEAEYEGLGSERLKLPGGAVLLVRPILRYAADGKAPREELVSKRGELRAAMIGILAGKKSADLGPSQEGRIKAELLDSFNNLLSVAQISSIYFLEYEIIE